jgi:hypothetical protein
MIADRMRLMAQQRADDEDRAERQAIEEEARDPIRDRCRELAPLLPLSAYENPPAAADGICPALGLAHGPPCTFVGSSFVGKTMALMQLALDVACGDQIWGVYTCRQSRVLHVDLEQGAMVTIERLTRMLRVKGFAPRNVVGTWWDSTIYPAMTLRTKGAIDLWCKLLEGYGLALIDALKGLTPGVDENSSEMADYLGTLRTASERTGCCIALAHHAGKTPQDGSRRPRGEMGRGSSAIKDQSQSWFVMTGEKYAPIRVSHEKTRASRRTVDDFQLTILDVEIGGDPMGGLRVAHGEIAADEDAPNPGVERAKRRIVEFIGQHAGCVRATRADLRRTLRIHSETFETALSSLLLERVVTRAGTYHAPEFRVDPQSAPNPLPIRSHGAL